ncbi:energy-converting hydrogenase A subunit O [Methanomicrobium sp. W14]|uniref:hydrogenase large subunit n=1 Tax=Methanomicrobium sp. W14 TaxID=2817839 RepID=UPI001AE3792B|nr:nickel-dependent hydrogenase large subunit [Methanomicrobium sp. W14]MBP2132336.1 energy-converting hydrogenase A subunit O [Methanomicrobium sp. W14]
MKKTVDVSLPIGPVHPCFKEPARIKCETAGEKVLSAEVELGYVKKGIEKIMVGRPWQEVMFLAERICGICSVIHNMVFIETVERISRIDVPERAAYLRVIVNELDRIQSHILANYSYCYTIEHETLAMYLINLRETALDQLELITGARITCAYIIPGGVRFDLREEDKKTLFSALDKLEDDIKRFYKMFQTGPLIALRSVDVGKLTKEDAVISHAVGPTARASGIGVDQRTNHPTYQALGFEPVVMDSCDNYGRIALRFEEILQSINIIRKCLNELPKGLIRGGGIVSGGEFTWKGEAPRGELTYHVITDEEGRISEIGIQTPSIMNIEACAHYMLKDADSAADVTSTFISSDPCIACNER